MGHCHQSLNSNIFSRVKPSQHTTQLVYRYLWSMGRRHGQLSAVATPSS